MNLYTDSCFIVESDETRIFQAAMGIAAKSGLDKLVPSGLDINSVHDEMTSILESDECYNYAKDMIGGETYRKINDDGIPPYQFWNLQTWAMNKLFGYEICEYSALILRDDFSNIMNSNCAIVMRYKLEPDNKKSPIRLVTVLGFDGSNVQFCNPMMDNPEDNNRFMNFEEFWEHTDSGGDLHIGIIFSSKNKKFSPEYKLPDYEFHQPYTSSDLSATIKSEKTNATNRSGIVQSESQVLAMSGADCMVISDANTVANDRKIAMLMSSIYDKYANEFIKTCVYPDHPTNSGEESL